MQNVTGEVVVAAANVDVERSRLARAGRLWSAVMMASGVIGVFAGVTGLLINVFFLVGAAENRGLMGILSIWLLVLAFPMLWVTSHCLDKVDAIDKAIRADRCKRSGLETIHRDAPSPGHH